MDTLRLTFTRDDDSPIHLFAESAVSGEGRGTFTAPFAGQTLQAIIRALEPGFDPTDTRNAESVDALNAAGLPTDEGLLVEDPLGLGQGNVISGAFSNSLSLAFKIEKGEIVGRVKDVSIAGNVYDLLQDVAAVSRETGWVYFNFNLPYVLLPDMNVVAKA